ncbi:MAG: DUF3037 domain-containing protein [Acidimicrobiaceae bacterium]|nr:DUF3037 domain-containing protein [Acidimicrobiaceae bacterium]
MEVFKGEYRILRLVPDRDRGERLNIGIVTTALPNSDLQWNPHLTQDVEKLRSLDPNLTVSTFTETCGYIVNESNKNLGIEGLEALITSFPIFELSDPASFSCRSDQVDDTIAWMMKNLVERPKLQEIHHTSKSNLRLRSTVRDALDRLGVLSSPNDPGPETLTSNPKFVQNYEINEGLSIRADFGAENGKLRLIEVLDLRVKRRTEPAKINEASDKALTLIEARKSHKDRLDAAVVIATHSTSSQLFRVCHARIVSHATQIIDMGDPDSEEGLDQLGRWINATTPG